MATCFLFSSHLTETSCLSIRLNDQGLIDAPLEHRSFDAIKALQTGCQTMVVLPCEQCTLHRVELPKLNSQKARAALPYALEEQVAQSLSAIHIAFDQQYYQNKQYLVAVIDKAYLHELMNRLKEFNLVFDVITLDWFALKADEACVSETRLLVNDSAFQGALSADLATFYLTNRTSKSTITQFADSAPALKSTAFTQAEGTSYAWLAKRLFAMNPLNLCQGELQHNTQQQTCTRWNYAVALLACLSLGLFLVINGILSYQLSTKIAFVDDKIGVLYHSFFPQSTQVISPKFRVQQLLKSKGTASDKTLWALLDALSAAFQNQAFTVEQFHYQNQTLSVTFTSQNFAALEALERRLQKANVKVNQTQAALHDKLVLATLELRL